MEVWTKSLWDKNIRDRNGQSSSSMNFGSKQEKMGETN